VLRCNPGGRPARRKPTAGRDPQLQATGGVLSLCRFPGEALMGGDVMLNGLVVVVRGADLHFCCWCCERASLGCVNDPGAGAWRAS